MVWDIALMNSSEDKEIEYIYIFKINRFNASFSTEKRDIK